MFSVACVLAHGKLLVAVEARTQGTYVAVEPFHLSKYVDEQVLRYNNRKYDNKIPVSDSERFKLAMSQVAGRRLTYADLIGKNESPRYAPTGTGANAPRALLILVGKTLFAYTLSARRSILLTPLLLGPYNFVFGNGEWGFHAFFKVLRCFSPFDVLGFFCHLV
jgi:hypothetical protein